MVKPAQMCLFTANRKKMPLHNRSVLVTGSSRGIGKVIASQLLTMGAKVIGTSRTPEPPSDFRNSGNYQHKKLDLADITQLNQFLVETDMARQSVSVYGEDYLKKGLSFDQLTQPADVAEIVIFLASEKDRHMTGSTFHVNGGSYLN